MAEPTINDYLDLIRDPLNQAVADLRTDITNAERQLGSKGQTGALIRRVLELGKSCLNTKALDTYATMERVLSAKSFDRQQLFELTTSELNNFFLAVRSVIEPIRRFVRGVENVNKHIDGELGEMERVLQLRARQASTGMLELGERYLKAGFFSEPHSVAIHKGEPPYPLVINDSDAGVHVNRAAITLHSRAVILLIDDRLNALRAERPNSEETKNSVQQAIAQYETLKISIEALETIAASEAPAADQQVADKAAAVRDEVQHLWDKCCVHVCTQAADLIVFTTCLGLCSQIGAEPTISAVLSAALAGRKTVADALNASTAFLKRLGSQ